ncbi:acyltransferase family protein [Sulfitobacter sp.]|uniref:acyltransferase family protein n=1 Tax=Sulfitobacter sp. TaxID=1903071 RepID=UPI003EF85DD1
MTTATTRFDVIDGAKGVGIIFVVFGHAWRGAQGAGIIPDTSGADGTNLFITVDTLIYAFHMPLFFLLSGLLFLEALQKHDTFSLLRGRTMRLLWPMALWTWLFFGIKLLAGSEANAPVTVSDFPLVPLPPFEHLWFLWALFLIQIGLVLAYRLGGTNIPPMTLRWVAGIGALALALINPYLSVPSLIWGPMVAHMPYFLLGITAGGYLNWRPNIAFTALSIAAFVALLWMVGGQKASVLHSLALVTAGWIFLLGALRPSALLRVLCVLGQGSMAIYLTHTIFSAALRIVMLKFNIDDLTLVLTATTLVGLIVPLAVLAVVRRLRLTKLLGF